MIQVRKSPTAPEKLRVEGAAEAARLKAAYDAGTQHFGKFKDSIYADPTVKAQLLQDQENKCCFCEEIAIESADVEHYRPKGKVTGAPSHPGYYWLAYDWTNLLACCHTCNSRAKNFLFPLADPKKRVTSHHGNLAEEEPLFLHPVKDDPSKHLWFDRFTILGMTEKGKQTVAAEGGLDLNRQELVIRRKELWTDINDQIHTLLLLRGAELEGRALPYGLKQRATHIEQQLNEKCAQSKRFSAMVTIEVARLYALSQWEIGKT